MHLGASQREDCGLSGAGDLAPVSQGKFRNQLCDHRQQSHPVISTYQRDDDRDLKNGKLALTGLCLARGASWQLPVFLMETWDTVDLTDRESLVKRKSGVKVTVDNGERTQLSEGVVPGTGEEWLPVPSCLSGSVLFPVSVVSPLALINVLVNFLQRGCVATRGRGSLRYGFVISSEQISFWAYSMYSKDEVKD